MQSTGLIHIYTGDGKGKTTAAVGLAVRALGGGLKVCYASFHKNPDKYGYSEIKSLERLGSKILIFAKGHPHLDKSIDENGIKTEVKEAFIVLEHLLKQEHIDMLIMDEILISVRDNYIGEELLLEFVKEKPPHLELVLTGRAATENIMKLADYVSFVKKLKHPYDHGASARKGIEF